MRINRFIPAGWKQPLRSFLWPVMPAWPDEGRRIVQRPVITELMGLAVDQAGEFRSALNAGTGEGGYSPQLLALPGLECLLESDVALHKGQVTRLDRKQRFFSASLTELPLSSRSVQFILCSEVLEHIPDDGKALDELSRVLTPGGWLLMSVPTPPAVPDANHVREGYQLQELSAMLSARGLEVRESRFCMHRFFRWILANWPRLPYSPKLLIRGLSYLDRFMPLGPPMDLLVLARLRTAPAGSQEQ